MHSFPRPTEPRLGVEHVPVEGRCAECGAEALAEYRVLGEGGWWDVRKCQDCLASLHRDPAPRLGSLVPLGSTV
jgi:vanillate/4-hydroxybenzoate decarboxylase subunit D